jgi:hypothetical protein
VWEENRKKLHTSIKGKNKKHATGTSQNKIVTYP